ncbi:lytic transglycosylase [Gibbsiella quercinecans]|uniref:transglycosylase SLT domain-containing protein n=1 Tax=Gibbsiella quercinecans TaxID=929813 RepID=UPI000EF1ED76|nr:transglycosylase SLT domain-containing protein [Gibbsiella quercinecans]RLM11795.1 lytic transglycosylase [Gibbsiella quercinecans]
MAKNMLGFMFLLASAISHADCFDLAGRDYNIDPDLLRAISWKESHFDNNAIGINPVSGYGLGKMQVDSQHFQALSKFGITPTQLKNDECMNIYTGAYILAIAFKKWGVTWQAIGAYNAGFKISDKQAMRRYSYAKDIEKIYHSIKTNKR